MRRTFFVRGGWYVTVAAIVLTAAAWLGDAYGEATPPYTPTFAVTLRPWT